MEQEGQEFKAILSYVVCSKPACATRPCLKKKKKIKAIKINDQVLMGRECDTGNSFAASDAIS